MTHGAPPPRGRRWLAGLLAAIATLLGGCTDDPDTAEQRLVQAMEDTFTGSFSYRLVAEADREALSSLGDALGLVAARLNLIELSGVVDGDVSSVDVRVLGTTPVLQVRRFGDDELYVRAGFGDGPLAALVDPDLEARVLALALQTGQPDSVIDAMEALLDGSWVAIDGAFDPLALRGDAVPPDDASAPALPTPLPDLVAADLVVVEEVDVDGVVSYRVDLHARDLVRTLGRLGGGLETSGMDPADFDTYLEVVPEVVTGDVVVGRGRVQAVVFDVAAAARADDTPMDGTLELRLELRDHGSPSHPAVPAPTVRLPSVDLAAGLRLLLQETVGVPGGP